MVINNEGEVLGNRPFFNADFVKSHKIRSFRGNYATKFDMDIIRENEDAFVYEFDNLGQLTRQYKIHMKDTLINTYQYDYKGNIVMHRESNKLGYYEYRYKYDDQNRVIQEELRRDKVFDHNKWSFELDKSTIVSTERFEYIKLEGFDFKKVCYNTANRIYRIEFYYFDDDQRLLKKESAMHNGRGRIEVNYSYNDLNQLTEIESVTKKSNPITTTRTFEYDEMGNVLSKKEFRNNKITSEDQLVYHEDTNELRAIITRGQESNKLTILKFDKYRHY
ncbi:MAG: hypothetical protein BM555_03970 [Crocinitomix sp. MedPE-SWsnd]|nr:MAG: hypothetical protein BM555_03970 [Crocinitomix sp. MedPE-SWsnd]